MYQEVLVHGGQQSSLPAISRDIRSNKTWPRRGSEIQHPQSKQPRLMIICHCAGWRVNRETARHILNFTECIGLYGCYCSVGLETFVSRWQLFQLKEKKIVQLQVNHWIKENVNFLSCAIFPVRKRFWLKERKEKKQHLCWHVWLLTFQSERKEQKNWWNWNCVITTQHESGFFFSNYWFIFL